MFQEYYYKFSIYFLFPHLALFSMLRERENWILSYNNCPEILKLYEEYVILYPDWKYGMSSDKNSKEVLIINKGT